MNLLRFAWTVTAAGSLLCACMQPSGVLPTAQMNAGTDPAALTAELQAECDELLDTMRFAEAQTMLERAVSERQRAYGPDDVRVAEPLAQLGRALTDLGQFEAAEQALHKALEMQQRQLPAAHPALAVTLVRLSNLSDDRADFRSALAQAEQATNLLRRSAPSSKEMLDALAAQVHALMSLGQFGQADAVARRALDLARSAFGPSHYRTGMALDQMAEVASVSQGLQPAIGFASDSLQNLEASRGPQHYQVAFALGALARYRAVTGACDEAVRLSQRSLEIREHSVGADSALFGYGLTVEATVRSHCGRDGDSLPPLSLALELYEKHLGPDHPRVASVLHDLADAVLERDGDEDGALRLVQNALSVRERTFGSGHPLVAQSMRSLGMLLYNLDAKDEGLQQVRQAGAWLEQALGPDHPLAHDARVELASLYLRQGDVARAQPLLETAYEARQRQFPKHDWRIAQSLFLSGLVQARQGDQGRAISLFTEAVQVQEAGYGRENQSALGYKMHLAAMLRAARQPDLARRELEQVVERSIPGQHLHTWALTELFELLYESGARAEASEIAERIRTLDRARYISPSYTERALSTREDRVKKAENEARDWSPIKRKLYRRIRAARPRFKACYDQALAQDADQSGRVELTLDVAPDGKVLTVSVRTRGRITPELVGCAAAVARALEFAASNAVQRVIYPIRYEPSE